VTARIFHLVPSLTLLLALFQASAEARVALEDRQGKRVSVETLSFTDETGAPVALARYFEQGRPVLMLPVYFGCPGPCSLALANLVTELKGIAASAGRGFEVVVLSIDPGEGPARAVEGKQLALSLYGRPETAQGWHFLTGRAGEIARLTRELGFEFEPDPRSGFISHPSALFVLTPAGLISRTLSGVRHTRRQLWSAIYDAGHGKIERFFDRLTEICALSMEHDGLLFRLLRQAERLRVWAWLPRGIRFAQP
jgi:protein SCO1/2